MEYHIRYVMGNSVQIMTLANVQEIVEEEHSIFIKFVHDEERVTRILKGVIIGIHPQGLIQPASLTELNVNPVGPSNQ